MKNLILTGAVAAGLCLMGCTSQTTAQSTAQSGSAPQFTAAELEALKVTQAKAEIMQLIYDYAMARDDYDSVAYGNAFAENGRFIFGGEAFIGPEVIGARLEAAPRERASLHMLGASQITLQSPTTATGRHYTTVYSALLADAEKVGDPIPISGPVVMGEYSDKYVLTDKGWKILERAFNPVFMQAKTYKPLLNPE